MDQWMEWNGWADGVGGYCNSYHIIAIRIKYRYGNSVQTFFCCVVVSESRAADFSFPFGPQSSSYKYLGKAVNCFLNCGKL